jgi:hypothetical protein
MNRLSLVWISLLLMAPQDPRPGIPSEAAQANAEKQIRDVFKEEYGSKSTAVQQRLAKKLVEQGLETKDDVALRYVLLREAGDVAVRNGDADTFLKSQETLKELYDIPLSARQVSLGRAEPLFTKAEDCKRLAEALLGVTNDAVDAGQYEVATKAAQSALQLAKKSKDIPLATRTDALVKALPDARLAFDRAKAAERLLLSSPEDPAANLAWGDYLCFGKGQWKEGLPFLAKGSDPLLGTLAKKELGSPAELAQQLEVADGWWGVAEKEKNPQRKSQVLMHCRALYEQALPAASGLAKMKIEKRIGEIRPETGASPAADGVSKVGLEGWWKLDEGAGDVVEDSSGHKRHGKISGAVERVEGRIGRGLRFAGKGELVSIPDDPGIRLSGDMTLALWFRKDSDTVNWVRLAGKGGDHTRNYGLWLGSIAQANPEQKQVLFQQFGVGIQDIVNVSSKTRVTLGAWTHVAAVVKGQQATLFINGQSVASANRSGAPAMTADPFTIGFAGYAQSLVGTVDEVRLYSRSLTNAEIEALASPK